MPWFSWISLHADETSHPVSPFFMKVGQYYVKTKLPLITIAIRGGALVDTCRSIRVLGPVHKQSQVNCNELELQFKSISSNFIGWICLQAHSYLARLCEPGPVHDSVDCLYHCWRTQQHLRSYRGGDHDDDDGWLHLCLTSHQHLRSYRGGDHDDDDLGDDDNCHHLDPHPPTPTYQILFCSNSSQIV